MTFAPLLTPLLAVFLTPLTPILAVLLTPLTPILAGRLGISICNR